MFSLGLNVFDERDILINESSRWMEYCKLWLQMELEKQIVIYDCDFSYEITDT